MSGSAFSKATAATCEGQRIDPFILQFQAMIKKYGFAFSTKKNVHWDVVRRLNEDPSSLSEQDWQSTGYPFLSDEKQALIDLSLGRLNFNRKETEALESVYADFFDLWDNPRNPKQALDFKTL